MDPQIKQIEKKEKSINTIGGVYLTRIIYKTKIFYCSYVTFTYILFAKILSRLFCKISIGDGLYYGRVMG